MTEKEVKDEAHPSASRTQDEYQGNKGANQIAFST